MSASRELIEAVQARVAGTPYRLEETDDGFDVGIDLADATYYTLMYQQHLDKTFTYRVELDEAAKVLAITDDSYELHWKRGADVSGGVPVPTLGAKLSRSMGRVESKSFQKVYAVNEEGRFGKVVDYSFDSAEGRRHIREPARELGWTEKRGTAERVGIAFALVGGLGALVTVVVLLFVLL